MKNDNFSIFYEKELSPSKNKINSKIYTGNTIKTNNINLYNYDISQENKLADKKRIEEKTTHSNHVRMKSKSCLNDKLLVEHEIIQSSIIPKVKQTEVIRPKLIKE